MHYFRLESTGQAAASLLSGEGQFTDPIRVTGIDASRNLIIVKTRSGDGPWSGTLTLQRSVRARCVGGFVTTYDTTDEQLHITTR